MSHFTSRTMKIKTVEIPIDERHDGTESTVSDTCDSSGNHIVPDGLAEKLCHAVDVSPTQSVLAHYEKTMGIFAAAMTELQIELRDKTNECEALYETARSLSQALQESDLLLQNKTLECERLTLKMQMVTFLERNDETDPLGFSSKDIIDLDSANFNDSDDYYAIPQRPAAILSQLRNFRYSPEDHSRCASAIKPNPESLKDRNLEKSRGSVGPVCVDDCDEDDDILSTTCSIKNNNPVCVDDPTTTLDDCHQTLTRTISDGRMQVVIGPSQAHFYHVILERDMAKQTNSKLTRDLRHARSKLRELKSKLDQSSALLRLAYESKAGSKIKEERKPPVVVSKQKSATVSKKYVDCESKSSESRQSDAQSCSHVRSLPWRRNYGIGSISGINRDKHDHFNISEYVSFISDDEMLSKNWNNTSGKAMDSAATEKYLNVILNSEDDADRAGGGGNSCSSLMDV